MQDELSPLRLMQTVFRGIGISVLYGIISFALIIHSDGSAAAYDFAVAFIRSYNSLISFGLIIGSTLIVYRSQNIIPETIETTFREDETELWPNGYLFYLDRYENRIRSLMIIAVYATFGFLIFSTCRFKISPIADLSMMLCACAQWGMGVYIGRKLCYAGMMLHSLRCVTVRKNLFKTRSLDSVTSYVHIIGTLTMVFVYVHVRGYYNGPFQFDTLFRDGPRTLLILPAFVATPVLLIFTFYSRSVVQRLYSRSIDFEIEHVRALLRSENLTRFEERSYLAELDKMSRDELRYSLQLALSDLPIMATVAVMVLEPVFGK
ncbi:MAG: hypothetical protein M3P06_15630 [Acidobacteriota bacterium]|nr:hypothetical protein [Acidobacteriota bacterium]